METLNKEALELVKEGFVSMPKGADPALGGGPVAGGGMLTQAQAAPMGGTPQVDPSMMGGAMPIDPLMGGGGGMPVDPAMAGGLPPAAGGGGLPPDIAALMGGAQATAGPEAGAEPAGGQISMSAAEFVTVIKAITGAIKSSVV